MKISIKNLIIIGVIILLELLLLLLVQHLHHGNLIYACGLFAYIGNDPGIFFSWDKFNALGLFNDDRGGDACGRVVDNKVQWGVDQFKEYKALASVIAPPNKIIKSTTVLGHCRKASSGGKNNIYAQPVILFKKDLNMKFIKDTHMIALLKKAKDTDIVFSGIHNGTIENYIELATRYQIPTENHNDSRVLLSILFYGNYQVLKEYVGTAALIWQNHLLNKTYIFKGQSKPWATMDKTTEERPLFAWKINDTNIYISSMDDSLKFIQDKKEEIANVKSNTLYKFKDGVVYQTIKFSRDECTQNKVYRETTSTNTNYWGSNFRGGNHKALPARASEKSYLDAEDVYYRGEDLPWDQKRFEFEGGKDSTRNFSIEGTKSFRMAFEKTGISYSKETKRAYYNKSRYWMNGNLMHGVYILSQGGMVPYYSYTHGMIALKPYYFVEGIMMDGLPSYKQAIRTHADFLKDLSDVLLDDTYVEDYFTFSIARYSRFPVVPLLNSTGDEKCYNSNYMGVNQEDNLYSGKFNPLFSSTDYTLVNGALVTIKDTTTSRLATHDLRDSEASTEYLNEVRKSQVDWIYSIGSNLLTVESYKNPISPLQKYIFENVKTRLIDYPRRLKDDLAIFMINYMRDFEPYTMHDCGVCVNEDTEYVGRCMGCDKLNTNLNFLKHVKTNGVVN